MKCYIPNMCSMKPAIRRLKERLDIQNPFQILFKLISRNLKEAVYDVKKSNVTTLQSV